MPTQRLLPWTPAFAGVTVRDILALGELQAHFAEPFRVFEPVFADFDEQEEVRTR